VCCGSTTHAGHAAAEFVTGCSSRGLGVHHVVVGHDFHFGPSPEGTNRDLRPPARCMGSRWMRSLSPRRRERSGSSLCGRPQPGRPGARHAIARAPLPHAAGYASQEARAPARVPDRHLALHRKVVPLGASRGAGERRGPRGSPGGCGRASAPARRWTAPIPARGAPVRLGGRPVRPLSRVDFAPACATSRSSPRSMSWWRRCTRRRRGEGRAPAFANSGPRRPLTHGRLQANRQPAETAFPDEGGPRPARAEMLAWWDERGIYAKLRTWRKSPPSS